MNSTKAETRFATLQARWQSADQAATEHRIILDVRYGSGNRHYAKRAETAKLERLQAAESRECNKFCAFLASIQGRDWSSKVPCSYLRDRLTYADAVSKDAIAVPPPSYGYLPEDMRRFAARVTA